MRISCASRNQFTFNFRDGGRKLRSRQRSGIDTIKYHTLPETPYGKVTKTQETSHAREPRVQPFPAGVHKAARNRQDSIIRQS